MSKSVKFVKIITPIALAIALSACGGGGADSSFGSNSGGASTTGGTDGNSTATLASSLELSVSSRQLPADGSAPITITAIAKDQNNNAIDNADIIFSVDKDATIIKNATVTTVIDPDNPEATPTTVVTAGSIQTATLTPGSRTNQTLTITVISGTISKSITIEAIGTEVLIDGPQGIALNKESPFLLKLKNSSNNAISYETVVLSSAKGNTITTDSNFITDAAGEIAFSVRGDVSGPDTITANVLGATYAKEFDVSGDEFTLSSASAAEINIKTNASIDFVWNKDGVPQAGKTIVLSATRGDIPSQTTVTDASGRATFTIISDTAGETTITATTIGGLSTTLKREFVATTPEYLNTQAEPTLVAPNGTSTIVAKIRDDNDNPVKNKTIDFRLTDSVNGVLSGSTAITDSLGRASVSYTAGNASSAKDGVVIKTFIQGYPAVAEDEIKLTVGGNALRIALGHDNLIASDEIYYIQKFGVIVTDSAGNPVKDQSVSFKINPTHYYKGYLWDDGEKWSNKSVLDPVTNSFYYKGITATCRAEDFNKNGNLDDGEDVNNSGFLEPTHDAAVTGSGITDENGKTVVEVIYPKSSAWWSRQQIEATISVDGTEFIETTDFDLLVLASDVSSTDIAPPNPVSPYGAFGGCTDDPNGVPPSIPAPDPIPTIVAIDPLTGNTVGQLLNNVVYSISEDGEVLDESRYTLSSDVVTVQTEPNNSFRLIDNDTATDNSGYFLNLSVDGGIPKILFYTDDAAILPETPAAPEPDTEAPEIYITGLNPVTITQGNTYSDAGATAVDLIDGNVTVEVVSGSSIDTSIRGVQSVVYRAVDSSNNATQAIREVIVVAPDIPLILLDDATSVDNVFEDLILSVGDVYFPNESSIDLTDGDLTVDVTGDVVPVDSLNRTTTPGTFVVNYTAVDSDGNVATATRTVIVNP